MSCRSCSRRQWARAWPSWPIGISVCGGPGKQGRLRLARTGAGHAIAFLGAAAAGVGALPAMLHRVAVAFPGAGLADVRAGFADQHGELATPAYEAGSQAADRGAIHVELDAARESPDV